MTLDPEAAAEADQGEGSSWLPKKFESPEAFADSYRHLESKLTQTAQQLREQQDQFEAYLSQQDAEEPPRMDRGQQLAQMQKLAEEAAFRGAKQVTAALRTGVVKASDDPQVLSRVATQVMPAHDPRWNETNPDVLASVINDRPELLSDMSDMTAIVSGLSTAAEIARGRQAEQTLSAWTRAEDMRDMKRQAMTLTGATGRPTPADGDEAAWERIQAAHSKTWANSRSG